MSASEIISLVAVVLSFATSLYALTYSRFSIKSSFKTASARTEMTIRGNINLAIEYAEGKMVLHRNDPSAINAEILKNATLRIANLYDDVCGLYLRGKIDKKGFFDNYQKEIKVAIETLKADYPEHLGEYKRLAEVFEIGQNPDSQSSDEIYD